MHSQICNFVAMPKPAEADRSYNLLLIGHLVKIRNLVKSGIGISKKALLI